MDTVKRNLINPVVKDRLAAIGHGCNYSNVMAEYQKPPQPAMKEQTSQL